MENMVVRMKGIVKERGTLQIGPMDLDFPSGYVTAIVGSNGSGKSTLMNMMMQLVHPDQGQIELLGHTLAGEHQWELKKRIGYVMEKSWNDQNADTLERIVTEMKYWYPTWNQALYERMVDVFEIDPKQRFGKMSKGTRRKCEFIIGFVHEPELLLLDEPSSGLDPLSWKFMLDEIRAYMDRGDRAVILASHIIDEVKRLADYVVFMHKGKLLGRYEKDQLIDDWKALWVEASPEVVDRVSLRRLGGVMALENESRNVVKIVTLDVSMTEMALEQAGLRVLRTGGVELDEILTYLIQQS
ncbi:ATP-binding cassette domain-containing protein [Paenibacillus terrigena]|uniref:ATP-binding cassette domain-containing protein n=1 Tax=Paenibacillus terrigena TaxID=369333 RepID=UPI000372E0F5|nr:ABC transporter ATP-binding protein [Paenibacillus terrigena]